MHPITKGNLWACVFPLCIAFGASGLMYWLKDIKLLEIVPIFLVFWFLGLMIGTMIAESIVVDAGYKIDPW